MMDPEEQIKIQNTSALLNKRYMNGIAELEAQASDPTMRRGQLRVWGEELANQIVLYFQNYHTGELKASKHAGSGSRGWWIVSVDVDEDPNLT